MQNSKVKFLEIFALTSIVLVALIVGFFKPDQLAHPLQGDVVLASNITYNLHNQIPFKIGNDVQWFDERLYYFYVSPLYYYLASWFWDNNQSTILNFLPSTALCVVFTYVMSYLFFRRYFGVTVGLLALTLMALSSFWLNYVVRSMYGSWAALPGVTMLLIWCFVEFYTTTRLRWMVLAGSILGIGFYFVTWPIVVIAAPVLMISVFFLTLKRRDIEQRFFGFFIFLFIFLLLVLSKEIFFKVSGLRFPEDPSGLETFWGIFFKGRWASEQMGGQNAFTALIKNLGDHLKQMFGLFFLPVNNYPGGHLYFKEPFPVALPMITLLARLTLLPGLIVLFLRKDIVSRLLFIFFIGALLMTTFLTESVDRYFLTIFPLTYLLAALGIIKIYEWFQERKMNLYVYMFLVLAGLGLNVYETFALYMGRVLPIYSRFEHNCYNSIEWPFEQLRMFLKDNKKEYDLVVVPNNFTRQMLVYLRLWPGLVHKEGESFGRAAMYHEQFRQFLPGLLKNSQYNVLIISNNYNHRLDSEICPNWSHRQPFDQRAITQDEIEQALPQARFLQHVGSSNYPDLLAVYELEKTASNLYEKYIGSAL
jgi:hypothetical protein